MKVTSLPKEEDRLVWNNPDQAGTPWSTPSKQAALSTSLQIPESSAEAQRWLSQVLKPTELGGGGEQGRAPPLPPWGSLTSVPLEPQD